MKDFIYIGATPCAETCFQVGKHPTEVLQKEALIFANQLRRIFPDGIFRLKRETHDFGTYFEVVAEYDDDNELQMNIAYEAEANTPEHWDTIAKQELKVLKQTAGVKE